MADNKVTLKYTWANILCWLQKGTISLQFPMGIKIPGSIKFELASSLELNVLLGKLSERNWEPEKLPLHIQVLHFTKIHPILKVTNIVSEFSANCCNQLYEKEELSCLLYTSLENTIL